MRDSNLHFNYIAEVIRCYLALVIECALRQPSATAMIPPESNSLGMYVHMCKSRLSVFLSMFSVDPIEFNRDQQIDAFRVAHLWYLSVQCRYMPGRYTL